MTEILDEIKSLRKEVSANKDEIEQLKIENLKLKQAANLNIFHTDNLEQYSRRENIRIYGIPEPNSHNNRDDGETSLLKITTALQIDLEPKDIQRVYRLGKRKYSTSTKPRPIIAHFISYKKRNQFLYSKSKLKETGEFNNAYITEDLTTLRSKLFNYIKNECDGEFVLVHTYNDSIRAKRSALKHGKLNDGKKDEGIGDWLIINSTDDLFKFNIDLDFKKLGYKPLMINI